MAITLALSLVPISAAQGDEVNGSSMPAGAESLFATTSEPEDVTLVNDREAVELGLSFKVSTGGRIVGLRYFRAAGDNVAHPGKLWNASGRVLGNLVFDSASRSGWQYEAFAAPIPVVAGERYVASYHTSNGYAVEQQYFDGPLTREGLTTPAISGGASGVYSYDNGEVPSDTYKRSNYWVDAAFIRQATAPPSASQPPPTPTPTPTPTPEFPGPTNTGVPNGVNLTPYTGPLEIKQAGTVIDAKTIQGTVVIAAPNVVIKRSKIIGRIDSDSRGASVTIADSEVDTGAQQAPGIGFSNLTVLRTEIRGGQHSVLCGDNCVVEDSWLHDQELPAGESRHLQAYLSSGGGNVLLRGNTFECTPEDNSNGGGCTADVSFFGDFDVISDVTVDGNLFKATPGGYCATFGYNASKPFGRNPTGIVVKNNVFERGSAGKCGYWGPVTGFLTGPGNTWSQNAWINGPAIGPVR